VNARQADSPRGSRPYRDEHRSTFEKAQEVYRTKMIEELDRALADAKAGSQIKRAWALPEPEDHTEDYDQAIEMLEMEVEDTVTIDSDTFRQLVQNRWYWERSFATNTMSYVVQQR
jgi:hypothetical protein